ncbi:hypothetical protein [Aliiroseovarius subalbicans]|uniref:hypothetical protein n=1 Tax=Aliiroseovarius subalbicans TaxID=2925840 RepID=UPI001F57B300|nr:hypothetical protein [Aliiroseovarius subalbicans]MCI2400278.1 hypothetical protein [Aliiroseovarius subalbicans]
MTKRIFPAMILGSALLLSACVSGNGLTPYVGNPNSVIATNQDGGSDKANIIDGEAAVVYDPDGCQNWMIDDGLEGYAGRRYDPVTGLPVCDNQYAPGTVVGQYQSSNPGIRDYVPHNGN